MSEASDGGRAVALGGPARQLSLVESAAALGSLRWLELEGHARLGRAAAGEDLAPGAAVWASGAAMAHAWRAGELGRLLPVSAGIPDAGESTRPASEAVARRAEDLEQALSAGSDADLVSWYGGLAEAYRRRVAHASASADGPLVRTLNRLASDVDREVRALHHAPAWRAGAPEGTAPPGHGRPAPGGEA